ncbi:MAG: hypothetical protein SPL15_07480 [Lachnospiraceae bacterium]|nr:hypothetical protein [Lachnospiraceae bacterium]MDY5742815.1 hypothetical protein [Lachnospiraceae bacterium]
MGVEILKGLRLDIFDILIAVGGLYALYQGVSAKYFKVPLSAKILPKEFDSWKLTKEGKQAYRDLLMNFCIVLGLYMIIGTILRALMLGGVLPKPKLPVVGAGIIDIVLLIGMIIMFAVFVRKDKKLKEIHRL